MKTTKESGRKVLALVMALTILIGLIPVSSITVSAALKNIDQSGILGRGFNALNENGVDLNDIGKSIRSDDILENISFQTTTVGRSRSNFISSETFEDFSKTYTESKTFSLNTNIPVEAVTFGIDEKFGSEAASKHETIETELFEVFYSENVTEKSQIVNLGGANGAKAHLTSAFEDQMNTIAEETTDKNIDNLFNTYGTHVITSVYLGGTVEITNYKYSEEKTDVKTLKNNSSLSASIGVEKTLSIKSEYSENSTNETSLDTKQTDELRTVTGYGKNYASLNESDISNWIAGLAGTDYVLSFVDQNSLIPVWEMTDNPDLQEAISSRYYTRLAQISGFNLESFIYQSPNANECSVVSFSDCNYVAPGSTVYFSLPYENATVSLSGNSGSFATIDNPSYGSVRFNSKFTDGNTVTVDFRIGGELIPNSSITFVARTEGKFGDNTYFAGGYGTEERPYLIANSVQLQNLQQFCDKDFVGNYYKLVSDIDLSNGFQSIDTFYGKLDGNGYTIDNWTDQITYYNDEGVINNKVNFGLISTNYGKIENLNLSNIKLCRGYYYSTKTSVWLINIGALCGISYGGIYNVTVSNSNLAGYITNSNTPGWAKYVSVGGVCGNSQGDMIKCRALNVIVYGMNDTGASDGSSNTRVGGVVGIIEKNHDRVTTDLYAQNCRIEADAAGRDDFLDKPGILGGYDHSTYRNTYAGGVIGETDDGSEVCRIISAKISFKEAWCSNVRRYSRYVGTAIGQSNCGSYYVEEFAELSDITIGEKFKSHGWRQNLETGELYFAKNSRESIESTAFPFVKSVTTNGIQMLDLPIFEYKIDGENWSGKENFTGLLPNSTHYVYIRYKETNTSEAGAQSNAITVRTLKRSVTAPDAPTLRARTHNSITLNSVVGCEYSKDGIKWQDNPVFSNDMFPYTEYTFYQRYAETETVYASETSTGLTVRTDKSTPETPDAPTTVDNGITDTTVTLMAIDDGEYSKDGVNWQENTEFVGLAPYTPYTFYQRVKAGVDSYSSATSDGLTVTTDKYKPGAPAIPTLSEKTDTTVTLNTVAGCEYSKDGIIWQKSSIFTELKWNKEYDFYQRYAETDTGYASEASAKATFKTDKFKPDAPVAPTAKRITATSIELHALPDCDCEYSMDGIHWQNETVFDNLSAATEYSFYQRIKEDANSYPSNASDALTVRTAKGTNSDVPNPPSLLRKTSTTVTLKSVSDAEFKCGNGEWQTSNIFTGLTPNTEYRFYVRYSETETQLASASSPALYVMTDKEAAPAPTAPTVKTVTATSIALNSIYNGEYSLDGLTWQNNPTFTGLSPATNYTFYQRVAETEEYAPSNASAALTVKTDKALSEAPAAPTVLEYTSNSITLNAVNGCEYSIDGVNWQRSTYFNELTPHTTYTAYQRIAETDTVYASASSGGTTVTTDKTTVNAPAAPVIVEKTGNSITVKPVAGCEYRIGDGIWQNNNTFDGLSANTEYVIYQRFAETDSCKASDASVGTVVITDKVLTENDPHITVESKSALPGGEITLSVDLSKNAGIAYLKLALNYDSDAFELISATNTGLIGGTYTTSKTTVTKPYIIQWMGADNSTGDGKILALTFKAKDDAEIGNYIIGLTVVEAYNEDYEDVAIAVENANIKLQNVIIGDLNGDEVINGKDGILCSQALAGWDVEYSEFAADVNGDGIFNGKDGILLSQYLAGWDVVLG